MRLLCLALFAEGPTDHAFLKPVIRRLAEQFCLRHGRESIDIADVLELHTPPGRAGAPRATRIAMAAASAQLAWQVLCIHTDGASDPTSAQRERVQPAVERIAAELGSAHRTAAVVPVRELEAWLLADGDALRAALGTTLDDAALGLPSPCRDVERVADPKGVLDRVYEQVTERRRFGAYLYDALGERVDLRKLRDVPAFAAFECDLGQALRDLRFI
jgi:hypothetical protein